MRVCGEHGTNSNVCESAGCFGLSRAQKLAAKLIVLIEGVSCHLMSAENQRLLATEIAVEVLDGR